MRIAIQLRNETYLITREGWKFKKRKVEHMDWDSMAAQFDLLWEAQRDLAFTKAKATLQAERKMLSGGLCAAMGSAWRSYDNNDLPEATEELGEKKNAQASPAATTMGLLGVR